MKNRNLSSSAMWRWDNYKKEWVKFTLAADEEGRVKTAPSNDFTGGPVTVGTTAVLVTLPAITDSVFIQADHDNSGTIWVGKSTVDSSGNNAVARLEAGESLTMDLDNENANLYVVSDTASQTIYKAALK